MKVLNFNDLDVKNFIYSEPKNNAMGGQSVYIKANDDDKIIIQTPKCAIPFGLKTFETANGEKKYSLELSLKGKHALMDSFKKFVQDFDDQTTNVACTRSNVWFKKMLDQTVIDELLKSTLKSNGDYPPLMKVKLPTKNDVFLGDIFDQNKKKVNMSVIEPDCTVQAILECVGIYFIAKEFGIK